MARYIIFVLKVLLNTDQPFVLLLIL